MIDIKTLVCNNLEDWDANDWRRVTLAFANYSEEKIKEEILPDMQDGFNSLSKKLILDGYLPYGDFRIEYSPTYKHEGMYATYGGGAKYIQQFVKYEE